jgi:hypothetical protein
MHGIAQLLQSPCGFGLPISVALFPFARTLGAGGIVGGKYRTRKQQCNQAGS